MTCPNCGSSVVDTAGRIQHNAGCMATVYTTAPFQRPGGYDANVREGYYEKMYNGAVAENLRLCERMARAPHAPECNAGRWAGPNDPGEPCTCWKGEK